MAEPKPFSPVKLVCGIMAFRDRLFERSLAKLTADFGPTDAQSGRHPFSLTGYYQAEMGPGLERMFVSFDRLVPPESLSAAKLRTNAIESEIRAESGGSGRLVNLDPGCLSSAALIMATAKDFSHRIPLRDGIYAHLEFIFHKKGLEFLPWTYPDFRDGRYTDFFLEARRIYARQVGVDKQEGGDKV